MTNKRTNDKLSGNFWLSEFLVSENATRFEIDMTPSFEVRSHLGMLCDRNLQPFRDHIKDSIKILSGYRPLALNRRIGGSRRSYHIQGLAGDIWNPRIPPLALAKKMSNFFNDRDIEYDKIILEYNRWVHLQIRVSTDPMSPGPNRNRDLVAYHTHTWYGKRKTQYALGFNDAEQYYT